MRRLWTLPLILLVLLPPLWAQAPNPASDPRAVTLASQALAALTAGARITDVTLFANVTRTLGSDVETGTATLKAKGLDESRVDLALSGGQRSDIRNSVIGLPQGEWIGSDGVSHSYPLHNSVTDASWFFPMLSSLNWAADPTIVLSYFGQGQLAGAAVQHIRSVRSFGPTDTATPRLQDLSAVDFYLDATGLLPQAIVFSLHPDDDANRNLQMTVLFSNYQRVNGVLVPFHIQEFFQGTLFLDFTVSNVVLNSGLPDSVFSF